MVAYVIGKKSNFDILKNKNGEVEEIHCTYDPDSKSGSSKNTKKIKGIIHWVSAIHSIDAEIRLYDRLYEIPSPKASSIDAVNANYNMRITKPKVDGESFAESDSLLNPKKGTSKTDVSKAVGTSIAKKAKVLGITKVVLDRGGYKYHGRVKALADAAREEGLVF